MPKESIQFSNLSIQFLDKKNDDDLRSDCYYYLAASYGLMGKHQEEIDYLHKAISSRMKNKQWREVGIEYNSLAHTYFRLQQFEEAINYFQLYLKSSIQFKDSLGISIAYNNIAEALESKGEYLDAIKVYNNAIALNQSNIAYSYTGLVRNYCKINKTDEAVHYFDKAYRAKADINELAQSCKILTSQFRKNKVFNAAFAYNDIYITLVDSIKSLSKKEVELLKPQYDVEGIQERIAQAEISELLKENYTLQSKQNRLLIIVIFLAIITSIFSVYIIRKRMLAKANKLKFVEKNVIEMGKYLKDMREIMSQR
jgi:pentatricopeptide repeat protein